MLFNATINKYFSYIVAVSFRVVMETGVPGENHRPAASQWQTLSQSFIGIRTLVVIDTDCIGSCKSNYHTITTVPCLH